MPYDAVVFDADGVLVEPTAHATLQEAIRRAFVEHGVAEPDEADIDGLRATSPDELRSVADRYGLDDPGAFWATRDQHASAAQRDAVRAGEKALYDDVGAALDLPVSLAVVSNNQQATVDFVLEQAGIADRFDPVFGRQPTLEDIARKKPDPHYLDRAIDALGAERPLFVGDSNVDLAAAEAAGVDSAFIRRPHREGYGLEHRPAHEIESLAELSAIVAAEAPARTDD